MADILVRYGRIYGLKHWLLLRVTSVLTRLDSAMQTQESGSKRVTVYSYKGQHNRNMSAWLRKANNKSVGSENAG